MACVSGALLLPHNSSKSGQHSGNKGTASAACETSITRHMYEERMRHSVRGTSANKLPTGGHVLPTLLFASADLELDAVQSERVTSRVSSLPPLFCGYKGHDVPIYTTCCSGMCAPHIEKCTVA